MNYWCFRFSKQPFVEDGSEKSHSSLDRGAVLLSASQESGRLLTPTGSASKGCNIKGNSKIFNCNVS